MDVVVRPDPAACGRAVADAVAGALAAAAGRPVNLGLATGSSPVPAYAELVRRRRDEGLSFRAARAFLLDEYLGLPAGHPESYRRVIRRELTDHLDIDPGEVHAPDGARAHPAAAAADYERLLAAAGPIDVQVLGIGTNGHIGFNEPGSPRDSGTRVATLTERTRLDNARFFGRLDDVPRHVLTQGLRTITAARRVVLVATGPGKRAAVAAAVDGPVTTAVPASVLQEHPHCTLVLDRDAAAGLTRTVPAGVVSGPSRAGGDYR
ncbi:glucosamine-6-phosphate deaminase [Pseudonocardia nematodicida]|uniref:Glucosamine-6-phosphate deaminase n=1 Tax=Pseudonocardia nematodicida TaxID=1206997 RepID=A0ABV1KK08_9PSEU